MNNHLTDGVGRFLFHYVRRYAASHLIVLCAVLAAVGCATGAQYGIKLLVDVLGKGHPQDLALWGTVGLLLALVAGDNLLWRLAGWVASKAFPRVGRDLRLDLFEHLSQHSTRYFLDQFPGALSSRVNNAATAAWNIENVLCWTAIPPAAAAIASIVLLATINWRLSAVLAALVTILGVAIGRLAQKSDDFHLRYAKKSAGVSGALTDIVNNIGLVHAFGTERAEYERLSRAIADEQSAQRESMRALERLRLLHALTVLMIVAGALAWSVMLWREGRISTGDVVLVTTLGFTVLHSSRDFAMAMVTLLQHLGQLREALTVVAAPHEMADAPDATPLVIRYGGTVAFQSVCFGYPDGPRVLHDFHLHVRAGEKVGLVGHSGAGKSTILALLQRHYDPQHGRVLIDHQDISKVTLQSLRRTIAIVQQEVALFHRSIEENIRYGRLDATSSEVREAARLAGCAEFIDNLPQGFATIVGERGLGLSGGQRQRIAIARAVLRNAPIVLLDEATSALDTDSELAIQQALSTVFADRTVIAVAHRLATLASFDRIVVIDDGRIIEEGSPAELLKHGGVYSHMYRQQLCAVVAAPYDTDEFPPNVEPIRRKDRRGGLSRFT